VHHSVAKALDQIDAAVFNSDTFFDRDDLEALKFHMRRWQAKLSWLEYMATEREKENNSTK
jgi:hypothetical protein